MTTQQNFSVMINVKVSVVVWSISWQLVGIFTQCILQLQRAEILVRSLFTPLHFLYACLAFDRNGLSFQQ